MAITASPVRALLPIRKKSKRLMESFVASGKPSLTQYRLEFLPIVYAGEFWLGAASRVNPDISYINSHTIPYITSQGWASSEVIVDIEHWTIAEVDKYVTVMNTLKASLPNLKIGMYAIVPERDYWSFNGAGDPTGLAADNRDLQPLARVIDFLCPSLYTFYTDQSGWDNYAAGNIAAAKAYGKPVYPFLWPQYHDGGAEPPELRLTYIDTAYLNHQIAYCVANADGFILWGNLTPLDAVDTWSNSIAQGNWWAGVQSLMTTY